MIDWQEQHDAIAFQNWDFYDLYDNALLPSAPVDHEPSSLDNVAPFNGDDTIFDNPVAYNPNPTPDSISAGSRPKSNPEDVSPTPGSGSASRSRVEKRKANTLAARRYRQNRLDKVATLELALKTTELERDALKVQVAKLQGETQVLKDLVAGERGRGGTS